MRQTITISLPSEVKRELDRVLREEGTSRSDLIRESLKDFLFIRRFRSLRRRMMLRLADQGIPSDQEVFDKVS
mgnify:CR=1 FL=1